MTALLHALSGRQIRDSDSQSSAWLHVQVIDDPSTDSLLLVMEHVDGGSLEQPYDPVSKTWESLPESLVHRHFRELCKVNRTF